MVVEFGDERNLPRAAVFIGGCGRIAAITAGIFAASRRSLRSEVRDLCSFAAVTSEVFFTNAKTTQKFALHSTSAIFDRRNLLEVGTHSQYLRRLPPEDVKFELRRVTPLAEIRVFGINFTSALFTCAKNAWLSSDQPHKATPGWV